MRHPSRSSVRVLAALSVASLALSACSGGDDADDAAAATSAPASSTTASTETTTVTTAPATTTAAAATTDGPTTTDAAASSTDAPTTTDGDDASATGDEDDDLILVDSIDDLPPECVDLLAEFLQLIEPSVADIDWDTATLGDFQAISDELESEFEDLDAREVGLGCDGYDLTSDEAAMDAAIEIAEQEAPGAVGWLEFLAALTAEQPSGTADEGPQDCESAIAYIEGLIADGKTISDIPFSEVNIVTQAYNVITADCPPEQATEFFQRSDVATFSS